MIFQGKHRNYSISHLGLRDNTLTRANLMQDIPLLLMGLDHLINPRGETSLVVHAQRQITERQVGQVTAHNK